MVLGIGFESWEYYRQYHLPIMGDQTKDLIVVPKEQSPFGYLQCEGGRVRVESFDCYEINTKFHTVEVF